MSDLEYCALIKLDFNTKEIAQSKDISIRTVESKKYRLRKKLNLPEDIKNINSWFPDF
jgi:DNA-binding CsgD family transcriptional regulator